MAGILEKMIAADVIVMATRYIYTMDAQMKTLIDRCVARYTEISNKAFTYRHRRRRQRSLKRTIEVPRVPVLSGRAGRHRLRIGRMEKGDIKESPAE